MSKKSPKKRKRPVGEPAARGIGVLEEQNSSVRSSGPALVGGEHSASRGLVLESDVILPHASCGVDRPPVYLVLVPTYLPFEFVPLSLLALSNREEPGKE